MSLHHDLQPCRRKRRNQGPLAAVIRVLAVFRDSPMQGHVLEVVEQLEEGREDNIAVKNSKGEPVCYNKVTSPVPLWSNCSCNFRLSSRLFIYS